MDVTATHTQDAPKAVGPYSQAIVAGDLVFCSGQIPLDPATGQMVEGDIALQTRRVLDSLAAVLADAGSDLSHVVKTSVFLADLGDFNAMNEAYALRFGPHRPARSTIEVGKLPRGAKIEIDCIAVKR
ncbi:MAG: RidA family protein [Chloroflexota bacterium]|nr:RidA family protein [Chloroflexota bacterium]MDE3193276.1 RidA family protein [Chloroflexota bacterium]